MNAPVEDLPPGTPWKERAAAWVFNQGASTVLLVGILCFLGYGALRAVPQLMEKQNEELRATRADFRAALTEQRQDFTKALDDSNERFTKAIDRLTDKVEK